MSENSAGDREHRYGKCRGSVPCVPSIIYTQVLIQRLLLVNALLSIKKKSCEKP